MLRVYGSNLHTVVASGCSFSALAVSMCPCKMETSCCSFTFLGPMTMLLAIVTPDKEDSTWFDFHVEPCTNFDWGNFECQFHCTSRFTFMV